MSAFNIYRVEDYRRSGIMAVASVATRRPSSISATSIGDVPNPSTAKTRTLKSRILRKESSTDIQSPTGELQYEGLHLLALPGEIRNHIYTFVFHRESTHDWLDALQLDDHFSNGLTALRTCRQIYHEAHDTAWQNFTPLLSRFEMPYEFSLPPKKVKASKLGLSKRTSQAPLHLVHRITVQQYLFYTFYSWWQLTNHTLRPKEVIFQYGICGFLDSLFNTPDKLGAVLSCIESAIKAVASLEKVVVFFCKCYWEEREVDLAALFKGVESPNGCRLEPILAGNDSGQGTTGVTEEQQAEDTAKQDDPVGKDFWSNSQYFRLELGRFATEVPRPIVVEFVQATKSCCRQCGLDRDSGQSVISPRASVRISSQHQDQWYVGGG